MINGIDESGSSLKTVLVFSTLIPVFSYMMSLFFFKENLTMQQIIGSIVIILSAVIISYDFEKKILRVNLRH